MAAKHDVIINELNSKVEKLIKLYISSLEKNKDLERQIAALENKIVESEREKQDLNEKLKTAKLANAMSGGESNHEAKLRINQLVREIDKCIALLNN